jgi:hypothetical protein
MRKLASEASTATLIAQIVRLNISFRTAKFSRTHQSAKVTSHGFIHPVSVCNTSRIFDQQKGQEIFFYLNGKRWFC